MKYSLLAVAISGCTKTEKIEIVKSLIFDESTDELETKINSRIKELEDEQTSIFSKVEVLDQRLEKDMKENVKKVIGNIEDATELKNRSDKIAEASKQFEKNAADVKKQSCVQNYKWWIIIGLILAVVILIIVLAVVPSSSNDNTEKANNNNVSTKSSASVNVSVNNRFL